jgi:hypothetical protein
MNCKCIETVNKQIQEATGDPEAHLKLKKDFDRLLFLCELEMKSEKADQT